jgi:hypothetical protein
MSDLVRRLMPIMLQDPDGQPVRLGDAWQEGPALIVFIRHFG